MYQLPGLPDLGEGQREKVLNPRPTHDRIHDLEQDLDRLRTFLTGLSALPPQASAVRLRNWTRSGDISVLPVENLGTESEPIPAVAVGWSQEAVAEHGAGASVTPSGAQYTYGHGR